MDPFRPSPDFRFDFCSGEPGSGSQQGCRDHHAIEIYLITLCILKGAQAFIDKSEPYGLCLIFFADLYILIAFSSVKAYVKSTSQSPAQTIASIIIDLSLFAGDAGPPIFAFPLAAQRSNALNAAMVIGCIHWFSSFGQNAGMSDQCDNCVSFFMSDERLDKRCFCLYIHAKFDRSNNSKEVA